MYTKPMQLKLIEQTLTKVSPTKIQPTQDNVAIVMHLFYSDIWFNEILPYIKQLSVAYDLYLTVPESMSEDESIQILQSHDFITLYQTENRGRDVLPFLEVLKLIGLDAYTYICKIHTKKTGGSALGDVWRKLLYFDLMGSDTTVKNILNQFDEDSTIGMITGKNTILGSKEYSYGNHKNIENLVKKSNLISDDYYLFAAGTMFWIQSDILKPLLTLFNDQQLHFEEEQAQADNTLAHAIERFFGILIQVQDKRIVESPSFYSELEDSMLNEVTALVLSQQYQGKDMFMAQKLALEEKEKEISYLIDIAESMRITNRFKNLKNSIKPLGKKILKIPQKVIKVAKVVKNNPSLLKKVFYYASRGELGYLITKVREKSTKNLAKSDTLREVALAHYFGSLQREKYTMNNMPIDIIIPVYNGYEFLEPLFDSVEKNTSTPYRLIVINDCSPDHKVKPYLVKRLENHPTSIFIDHKENQGFLKSVNEAYTHTSNHFVLLNTDTEVPSFWLERLMYPILHMDNIASTTPFTNSGEIASFPNFVADNAIFDGLTVEDLDASFKEVNPRDFYAQVPTGVGFCMGVNRDIAKNIGMFAEDTFGKGYGEENDWCQRAIKEGYKNLIVPNLFVFHKHGGSFTAEEKQKLLQKNAVTLLERHPNYGKDVNTYIEQNPHETLRHLLVLKASNQTDNLHLIFDHGLGGGANLYTNRRIANYLVEEKNVLLVTYDYYSHCFVLRHQYKSYDFSFKITEFEDLSEFIDTLNLEEIFLNNLVSYKNPHSLLKYLTTYIEMKATKLILPIHDFYTLCPSYNLLNEKGTYCDVPDLDTCKTCMQSNLQEWRSFYTGEVDIVQWRESWGNLIKQSHEILAFSNSSKELFLKAYPNAVDNITLIPHEVKDIGSVIVKKNTNKTTTIGVLGAINYVKGAQIIKQMIQLIERDKLDINIVVIGEITESIESKHFYCTGRYKRSDLPEIIQETQINVFLIPSVWPETFSYTTQEIMMMQLPLMVFDLGAPAERVKKYDKGTIINEVSAQTVLNIVKEIQ